MSTALLADDDVNVRATNAEGVNFAVEVTEHLAEGDHIAIGADALNFELLAEDFNLVLFIALAGAEAYRYNSFHGYTAIASISTSTPLGRPATSTVERAGGLVEKTRP